jgi:hypothetical protein
MMREPINILLVILGCVCLGLAALFVRRSGDAGEQLREYRMPWFKGEGRWPPPADLRYQLKGWPLVSVLRRAVLLSYTWAIVGLVLLMYACPKV